MSRKRPLPTPKKTNPDDCPGPDPKNDDHGVCKNPKTNDLDSEDRQTLSTLEIKNGPVLAIVGSRNLSDVDIFRRGLQEVIDLWGRPIRVVSGGARGADTLGERWAERENIPCDVFKPEWRKKGVYNQAAGIMRNHDIIEAATHVLAFPSRAGRGTQHSIGLAKKAKKPTHIAYID